MKPLGILLAGLACATLAATALASSSKSNVGTVLPQIDVQFLKNKPEQTAGKPMIVEFWATWCPPCRASIPHLNEIHAKFKDKGLVIVGITKEDAEIVEEFTRKVPMEYAVAQDKDGKFASTFGIKGIPHAMLVDKTGKIVWEGHPTELEDKQIEKLL